MEISNIFTAPSNGSGVSVGYGNVTFEGNLFVNFGIMKSSKDGSLWISWPQRLGKDKEGKDKWFPQAGFTEEGKGFRAELEEAILESFGSSIKKPEPKKTYAQKKEESEPEPKVKKKLWNKPA